MRTIAEIGGFLAVGLLDFTGDADYYLAGADPYRQDQLGGLALTVEGLLERDRIVLDAARSRSIPIAVTFAGGYARNAADTIQIHTNTILAARESFTSMGLYDEHV